MAFGFVVKLGYSRYIHTRKRNGIFTKRLQIMQVSNS